MKADAKTIGPLIAPMQVLQSTLDASRNFIWPTGDGEAIEARYVRRRDDYVAVYLSSQTACSQGCRMCHLTATGQTRPRSLGTDEIIEQAEVVLDWYDQVAPTAKRVHFNFMARGEPLVNEHFISNADAVLLKLAKMAETRELVPRFNISTIIPVRFRKNLHHVFRIVIPDIYYSLYSMDPDASQRWLPSAASTDVALNMLSIWQRYTSKIPRVHFAVVQGLNDTTAHAVRLADALQRHSLRVNINLVRFNPPRDLNEKEASDANKELLVRELRQRLPLARVKVVSRVGTDVYASCGTFA